MCVWLGFEDEVKIVSQKRIEAGVTKVMEGRGEEGLRNIQGVLEK